MLASKAKMENIREYKIQFKDIMKPGYGSRLFPRREFIRIIITTAAVIWLVSACSINNEYVRKEKFNGPEFCFGVVADVQYGDFKPGSSRYYRNSLAKLQKCVDHFNSNKPLFVIQLGDFIESADASYRPVLSIYNQLGMPHYHVLGNHDCEVKDTPKDKVTSILGLKNAYYDFAYNGWRFVVLNSNDISTYGTVPGSRKNILAHQMLEKLTSSGAINAQSWNGALGPKQKAWFAETLAAACRLHEKVIIFCHHPVYPSNAHNLWNDHEIIGIIESYDCVFAYMNGHNHAGNYGTKNGVHYLTLHGMVETKGISSYAMIEVYADHLKVVGYGREPRRILKFNHSRIPE